MVEVLIQDSMVGSWAEDLRTNKLLLVCCILLMSVSIASRFGTWALALHESEVSTWTVRWLKRLLLYCALAQAPVGMDSTAI